MRSSVEVDAGERLSRSAVASGTYGRCCSSSEQLARPTRTPSSSPIELVEQSRLAESRLALDLDQRQVTVERLLHGADERVELGRRGRAAGTRERPAISSAPARIGRGQQRVDVLLADDGRFERTRLPARLEPELLVQPHAEAAVAAQRLVGAAERVEREHLGAVRRAR